ncbi:hypothetical protein B6A10_09345 [Flavobacterium sp. L1I52]|uniref:Uncharacterized protein n=1 Tax=Flavobacterium pokkalii TaxID=1940408 RepID=A0ABR7URV1_9FLAO|nr:hypothetical protein [Flavobacterium pokkalii]MBD0725382.1 hypothetical protein [Flavobacterium pokkalii]
MNKKVVEDIQFRIIKDASGENVSLDNMSIKATNSLIEILTALRNIAQYESRPDLTIGVKRGSACASINGNEGLQVVRDGFLKVFNNDSERNNIYVHNMQIIKDQITNSELDFEVSFLEDGERIPVIELFGQKFRKKRERREVENNFNIEFFEAELMESGGNRPNFHVKRAGHSFKIKCERADAIKISPFLYKTVKFSAWAKMNSNHKMEYTLCDIYNANERDFYNEFKEFFKEQNRLEGTAPLKRIHYKLKDFYSNEQFKESRKFLKLYCNDLADINDLTTILIISKAFKHHNDLKDLLKNIEDIIVSKTKKRLV